MVAAAASVSQAQQAPAIFEPKHTKTLANFGAVGNGVVDDTRAIRSALDQSDQYCLGTLRVTKNLCLKRVRLKQGLIPFDTSPFITQHCTTKISAFAVTDCGNPVVPKEKLAELRLILALRTLLIRPETEDQPLRVNLSGVIIDRGPYPESGSRQDAAGIWLDGADRVDFRNVEITGSGKGYGLFLTRSKNVTLDNLHIYDIVWAPFKGDAPLDSAKVAASGWNSVPIQEFRTTGEDGVTQSKFYGVRIQEQVTCAYLGQVENVVIRNSRVARCHARFGTVDMPWQADGLDIGGTSSHIFVTGTSIDSTWEGIDVVAGGNGVQDLKLEDVTVTNSFSFGIKLGYRLSDVRVSGARIDRAGLAGIVVYGPVRGASIANVRIRDVGSIAIAKAKFSPWEGYPQAGIRLDEGSSGTDASGLTPADVIIRDSEVASSSIPGNYDFGFLNLGAKNARLTGVKAKGFRKSLSAGFQ